MQNRNMNLLLVAVVAVVAVVALVIGLGPNAASLASNGNTYGQAIRLDAIGSGTYLKDCKWFYNEEALHQAGYDCKFVEASTTKTYYSSTDGTCSGRQLYDKDYLIVQCNGAIVPVECGTVAGEEPGGGDYSLEVRASEQNRAFGCI